MWRIDFNEVARADLLSFDKPVRNRILKFLEERVASHPDPKQLAEPLAGSLQGLHRFRVGDYRLVAHLRRQRLIVLVLFIDHRSVVYKQRALPNDFVWEEDEDK